MKYVVFADNYSIARYGASRFLKEYLPEDFCIEVIKDMEQLIAISAKISPDIVIVSINDKEILNYIDQIEICRQIFPFTKIAIYVDSLRYEELISLVSMGVSGFLYKSGDGSQLLECIHQMFSKGYFLGSEVIELILLNFTALEQSKANIFTKYLSMREKEIASYVITGMKISDIALRLGLKVSTISSIKYSMFKKMKVDNVMALNEVMSHMKI